MTPVHATLSAAAKQATWINEFEKSYEKIPNIKYLKLVTNIFWFLF